MDSIDLTCQYKDCGFILNNPVTLSCGKTLCLHHLDGIKDNFICIFCKSNHPVSKDGFSVNKTMEHLIKDLNHCNAVREEIRRTSKTLDKSIKEYQILNPDEYICEYFGEIKNRVDLNREESI